MPGAARAFLRCRLLAAIPLMTGVPGLVADGLVPAGCYRNRDHYRHRVAMEASGDALLPLFDPQTSGGLLIALPPGEDDRFLRQAHKDGIFAVRIGEVFSRREHSLEIV